jgi:Arc/MetJ-type ribon-helix-helix transcriptional regulator
MTAKTVGFAISDEDREQLDLLVDHFGHGNRSEFLRVAMKRLRRDMWAENLQQLQAEAREQLGGRVVSREEVTALVKQTLRDGD